MRMSVFVASGARRQWRLRCRVSDAGPSQLFARALRAGVRKPPRKEPAGRRAGGCRLWGFNRAAARTGDPLAGVDGVGSTVAVMDWGSRWPSRGRCYRDRGYKKSPRRQWGNSGALPEAVFSGG